MAEQPRLREYARYHPFDSEGRFVGQSCVIVALLPLKDVGRISLGLVDESKKNGLWQLSDLHPQALSTRP